MALDTLRAPRLPQLTVTGDPRTTTRLIRAARTHQDPRLPASPGGLPKASVGQNQSLNWGPQHSRQGGAAARERGAGIFLSSSACLRVCCLLGFPKPTLVGSREQEHFSGGFPTVGPFRGGGKVGSRSARQRGAGVEAGVEAGTQE